MPGSLQTRAQALAALREEALGCARCPKLAATRTQVVFGGGPPDATLMVVGEAPGVGEDRLGVPLAGPAGALLDELLSMIGLRRADVALVNVVNCRPPDNRSPLPGEVEHCRRYLLGQLELTQPVLVCSLGTFATRALRGAPGAITALRGRDEVVTIGTRAVRLLPLVHPAAALYTPAGVRQLREDVARIPALLALGPPPQPDPVAEPEPAIAPHPAAPDVSPLPPARGPSPEAEPFRVLHPPDVPDVRDEPDEPLPAAAAPPAAEQLNLF